jgi:hypothetical protein
MTKEEQNELRIMRLFDHALEWATPFKESDEESAEESNEREAAGYNALALFNRTYRRIKELARDQAELDDFFNTLNYICNYDERTPEERAEGCESCGVTLMEALHMEYYDEIKEQNNFCIVWSYEEDRETPRSRPFPLHRKHPFPKDVPLTDSWASRRTDYNPSNICIEGDTWLDVWRAVDAYGKYHWWELGDHIFFESLKHEGNKLEIHFGS